MRSSPHRVLPALVLLLAAVPATAQLIAYDGFGNGPLANLAGSAGGSGWAAPWFMAGDNVTKVGGAGLTWPGLMSTPGGAITPAAGGVWPSSIYQRSFALPVDANAMYASFLLRDDAASGIWGGLSFGTYPYKMTVGSPLGDYTYGLMLSEGLGDLSNKPLVKGEISLVVVKISKNTPAAGISYRMYLDPAVGSPEPGFPDAMMSVGAVGALPAFVSLDNGTGFTTDELRVGTTWASVLPPGNATWSDLGHAKVGSHGRPVLAGTGALSAGSVNRLDLVSAGPLATVTLVCGFDAIDAPFKGGVLVPQPEILIPLQTDALGSLSLPFLWPTGVPAGTAIFFQDWIQDAGATHGLSASNALQGLSS